LLSLELPLCPLLQSFLLSGFSFELGLAFLGDAVFLKDLLLVFLELLVILLDPLDVLCNFVGVVDIQAGIILVFLILVGEFGFFLLAEVFPVVFDHFVYLDGCGVFVLLGVLGVPLLDEAGVGREYLLFSRKFEILLHQGVPFPDSDSVYLFVEFLFVG